MRPITFPLFTLLAFSLGCSHAAFMVSHVSDRNNIGGIPFYAKVGVCEETTVAIAPYYRFTYEHLADGKPVSSDAINVPEDKYGAVYSAMLPFVAPGADEHGNPKNADVKKADDAWKAQRGFNVDLYASGNGLKQVTVSDSAEVKGEVDYTHEYTLNAKTPAVGSVNATYKLAPDGTLSEGSAQMEDKTLPTILSLFPVSDVLKAAATSGLGLLEVKKPEIQLKVERRAMKNTTIARLSFDEKTSCKIGRNGETIQSKLEDVSADAAQSIDKNANDITVKGTITLPKADTGAPASAAAPAAAPKGQDKE